MDTALSSGELTALASDCEDVITDWAGPLVNEGYPEDAEEVTETVYGRSTTLLRLRQRVGSITTVTDTDGDTDTELVEADGDTLYLDKVECTTDEADLWDGVAYYISEEEKEQQEEKEER